MESLFDAIESDDPSLVARLLAQGADPNQGRELCVGVFPFRQLAPQSPDSHELWRFHQQSFFPAMLAAALGRRDCLELLIQAKAQLDLRGVLLLKTPIPTAWTALGFASAQAHAPCVELLLKAGAKARPAATGRSPLMLASLAGCVDCMRLLFDADPKGAAQAPNFWSRECWLGLAASSPSKAALEFALSRSDPSQIEQAIGAGGPLQAAIEALEVDKAAAPALSPRDTTARL